MNKKTKHTPIDTKRRDEIAICKYCKRELTEIDKWTELMRGKHADCEDAYFGDVFDVKD
jgi:hypothetical protein